MPSISDPLWPFTYPAGSVPLPPWQDHFLDAVTAIATVLTGYQLAVTVADETDRNDKFPSPAEGDKVFRADRGYIVEIYDGSVWRSQAGGWLQAQRHASQNVSNESYENVGFTGATIISRGYTGVTFDSATGIATVDEDGQFDIFGQVTFEAGGTSGARNIYVLHNSDDIQGTSVKTGDVVTIAVRAVVEAVAGDTINLRMWQSSGGTRQTRPSSPYPSQLIIQRIG